MSPEYDAFGRPTEDLPTGTASGVVSSGTGSSGTGSSGTGSSGPGRPSGGGTSGLLVAVVIAIVVVGVIVLGVASGGSQTGGRTSSSSSASAARDEVSGASAARLIEALRRQMHAGELATSITVSPDRLYARLAMPAGPPRNVTIEGDGRVGGYAGTSSAGAAPVIGIGREALDAQAPARMIAAALRGVADARRAVPSSISLFPGTPGGTRPGWSLSLGSVGAVEGRWQGDEHGEHVTRGSDGAPAPGPGQSGPARVPTGYTGTSLLAPANLRRALAAVGRVAGTRARLRTLALRPGSLSAYVDDGDTVRVDSALGVSTSSSSGGSDLAAATIPLSHVDPDGPARALRAVARRTSPADAASVQDVFAFVLPTEGSDPTVVWSMSLGATVAGRDRSWRASVDGRRVGRPGESGAP